MPNVIYNRIPNRKSEQRKEVQEAIRKLQKTPGVHLFNPSFFDKWTLYKHLLASEEFKSIVPDSTRLDNLRTLQQMSAKYPILYLKPVAGKAGIGMMRITGRKQGYELIYQSMRGKKKLTNLSLASLWPKIQTLCQKRSYVIQQGIPLALYRGSPFDVRMLLQKNGEGVWTFTGAGIRVAGKSAISTHVPMGGRIENIHVVLTEVFGAQKDEVYGRIEEIGLAIARFIEAKQLSKLGEMSIDLGVEKNGRMWFFEANAKPMKFDEPEIRSCSLRRLIQYCLYLSGYKQSSGGAVS
nr:YheC/YheD family protein [Paenactinomyces guangxiensis]